jgi:outer membrane protein TolC
LRQLFLLTKFIAQCCWKIGATALFAGSLSAWAQPAQPINEIGRELDGVAKALIDSIEQPNKNISFDALKPTLVSALDNIPALLKRIEETRFLEARREETRARLLPKLSLSTGAGASDTKGGASGDAETHTLSISQLVFDFGTSIRSSAAQCKIRIAAGAPTHNNRSQTGDPEARPQHCVC